jgi:hypothetical protein
MNEKASFMDIKNLIPVTRMRERKTDLLTRSLQLPASKTQRRLSVRIDTIDPSSFSLNELNNNDFNSSNKETSINRNFLSADVNTSNGPKRFQIPDLTPILPTIEESDEKIFAGNHLSMTNDFKKRNSSDLMKNDTRIVNEAFQDSISVLKIGFHNKIKAEIFVLVDVLIKPASVLSIKSNYDTYNESFIQKYI